ncbi:MAG: biotin/lipoyl-binding protein, partial [Lysobacterales bacterium]
MSSNEHPRPVADKAAAKPNGKRRKLLAIVLGALLSAGLVYGIWWLAAGRWVETTDDAYVDGNIVQITPRIAGTVEAIYADDTDFVQAGEKLVQLDPSDARLALHRDEAKLGQTVRRVRALFDDTARLKSVVKGREVDLARARADLAR